MQKMPSTAAVHTLLECFYNWTLKNSSPGLSYSTIQFTKWPSSPQSEIIYCLSKSWKLSIFLFHWKFQVWAIAGPSVIQEIAPNIFKVMRSHFCGCCWNISHKGFHSVWNGTFTHDRKKKRKSQSLNDSEAFEPQVKYHCVSSSPHQILLLVLIENPWGSLWKQCSALEKWAKKMSLSFLSKCCVWGPQYLNSYLNYFT